MHRPRASPVLPAVVAPPAQPATVDSPLPSPLRARSPATQPMSLHFKHKHFVCFVGHCNSPLPPRSSSTSILIWGSFSGSTTSMRLVGACSTAGARFCAVPPVACEAGGACEGACESSPAPDGPAAAAAAAAATGGRPRDVARGLAALRGCAGAWGCVCGDAACGCDCGCDAGGCALRLPTGAGCGAGAAGLAGDITASSSLLSARSTICKEGGCRRKVGHASHEAQAPKLCR